MAVSTLTPAEILKASASTLAIFAQENGLTTQFDGASINTLPTATKDAAFMQTLAALDMCTTQQTQKTVEITVLATGESTIKNRVNNVIYEGKDGEGRPNGRVERLAQVKTDETGKAIQELVVNTTFNMNGQTFTFSLPAKIAINAAANGGKTNINIFCAPSNSPRYTHNAWVKAA
jgi:hypothetical protein